MSEPPKPTASKSKFSPLWRHSDFIRLWLAQTVSRAGDYITFLAFPLTAVVVFKATASQMGILRALYSAAAVGVGLFVGMWTDRLRRRPILVWTDVGFTLLYLSIPIATTLHLLHIAHLYVVQFISGVLWFFSDVAFRSFLPSIVNRKQLVEANSKLGLTHSVASMAGPSLAGAIVQLVTAPIAMAFDALSFLVSALLLRRIRTPEVLDESRVERKRSRVEILEGLSVVFRSPLLRPLTEALFLQHFFTSFVSAVFVLYATNNLKIQPFFVGIIFSAYGPGYLIAALTTSRITNRCGLGTTIIASTLLNCFAIGLIAFTQGSMLLLVLMLITAHFLIAASVQLNEISTLSLRQTIAPPRLQGRVNGSFRLSMLTADLIGALMIALFGDRLPLRGIIAIAALGLLFPSLRLLFSPIKRLRELPDPQPEEAGTS